jgi:TolA-binding protein
VAILKKILYTKAAQCVRLFLFSTLLSINGYAKAAAFPNEQVAFRYFLNLEFDSCLLQIKKSPDQPYHLYLQSLVGVTRIFMADDENLYKAQKEKESEWLANIEKSALEEKQKIFLISELKIQWAILKMKYGDEFSAFWDLRQAFHFTQSNLEKYPDFIPSYKSLGFLNVLFGVVPTKYNWILSIFGVNGNVKIGMQLLSQVSMQKNPYAVESSLVIALLNTYLLNQHEKGLNSISKLQQSEYGILVDYAYGLIAIKNSNSELALNMLKDGMDKYEQPFKLPQLYYLLGEIYLQKGDFTEAIKYYNQFIDNHSGLSLIKDAYYKIGICYLILNQLSTANNNFDLALKSGWTKNEADSYAQEQVELGNYSDKDLYRLRYATDGGFYENAFKVQSAIDPDKLEKRDLCEYYYRTARLMQKTYKLNLAIEYYKKTLDHQNERSWYFAPNAALQLGLIYKNQNNDAKAKAYLEMVFNYKNHPYQKSIRQKAKINLNTLD